MANGHGGKRPGAGRKRKDDKHEGAITAAEATLADALPQVLDRLLLLATGAVMEREEYEPAGLVTRDATQIEHTDKGPRALRVKELAFPDKKPDDLVLVKRVVQHEPPDVRAVIYAVDRILGKPTERHEIEADITGQIDIDDAAKKQAAKELSEWRETMKAELASALGSNPLGSNPTGNPSGNPLAPTESSPESSSGEPSSSPRSSPTRPTSSTPIV